MFASKSESACDLNVATAVVTGTRRIAANHPNPGPNMESTLARSIVLGPVGGPLYGICRPCDSGGIAFARSLATGVLWRMCPVGVPDRIEFEWRS